MTLWINVPKETQHLQAEPLTQTSFSQFGTVIENPSPLLVPSQHLNTLPPNAIQANQGSALKYLNVTHMRDFYSSAPSKQPSKAVMNMFVCAPRQLVSESLTTSTTTNSSGNFPVRILERHPFTTQTFIPLGLSPKEAQLARYLVLVAPTLPPSQIDKALPVPQGEEVTEGKIGGDRSPGRGLPDLCRMRAFMANGSQAVTYSAGTWHAPMVVIGKRPVSFVVVQFANGVGLEDCQEVEWENDGEGRIEAVVPRVEEEGGKGRSGRGLSRM